jgi:flagella basal body P-ring formation protein FlgA
VLRIAAPSAAVTAVILGVMYLRFSGEPEGVPVVVAERNIAAGIKITDEMVEVAHVANEHVVESAYTDPALAVGKWRR